MDVYIGVEILSPLHNGRGLLRQSSGRINRYWRFQVPEIRLPSREERSEIYPLRHELLLGAVGSRARISQLIGKQNGVIGDAAEDENVGGDGFVDRPGATYRIPDVIEQRSHLAKNGTSGGVCRDEICLGL